MIRLIYSTTDEDCDVQRQLIFALSSSKMFADVETQLAFIKQCTEQAIPFYAKVLDMPVSYFKLTSVEIQS